MIRTVVKLEEKTISLTLPQSYIGREIEIIAFAKDEGIDEETLLKKTVTFDAITLDTRNFKFDRNEANER